MSSPLNQRSEVSCFSFNYYLVRVFSTRIFVWAVAWAQAGSCKLPVQASFSLVASNDHRCSCEDCGNSHAHCRAAALGCPINNRKITFSLVTTMSRHFRGFTKVFDPKNVARFRFRYRPQCIHHIYFAPRETTSDVTQYDSGAILNCCQARK